MCATPSVADGIFNKSVAQRAFAIAKTKDFECPLEVYRYLSRFPINRASAFMGIRNGAVLLRDMQANIAQAVPPGVSPSDVRIVLEPDPFLEALLTYEIACALVIVGAIPNDQTTPIEPANPPKKTDVNDLLKEIEYLDKGSIDDIDKLLRSAGIGGELLEDVNTTIRESLKSVQNRQEQLRANVVEVIIAEESELLSIERNYPRVVSSWMLRQGLGFILRNFSSMPESSIKSILDVLLKKIEPQEKAAREKSEGRFHGSCYHKYVTSEEWLEKRYRAVKQCFHETVGIPPALTALRRRYSANEVDDPRVVEMLDATVRQKEAIFHFVLDVFRYPDKYPTSIAQHLNYLAVTSVHVPKVKTISDLSPVKELSNEKASSRSTDDSLRILAIVLRGAARSSAFMDELNKRHADTGIARTAMREFIKDFTLICANPPTEAVAELAAAMSDQRQKFWKHSSSIVLEKVFKFFRPGQVFRK